MGERTCLCSLCKKTIRKYSNSGAFAFYNDMRYVLISSLFNIMGEDTCFCKQYSDHIGTFGFYKDIFKKNPETNSFDDIEVCTDHGENWKCVYTNYAIIVKTNEAKDWDMSMDNVKQLNNDYVAMIDIDNRILPDTKKRLSCTQKLRRYYCKKKCLCGEAIFYNDFVISCDKELFRNIEEFILILWLSNDSMKKPFRNIDLYYLEKLLIHFLSEDEEEFKFKIEAESTPEEKKYKFLTMEEFQRSYDDIRLGQLKNNFNTKILV